MISRMFVGLATGGVVGVAAIAGVLWPASSEARPADSPALGPPMVCPRAMCAIDVVVEPNLPSGCWVKLSSEVTLFPAVRTVEWRLKTAGYKFVDGDNAVTIVNDAGDFGPGSTIAPSPTHPPAFRRDRTASSPVSGRVYKVKVNIVSDSGTFCKVPTLPRIKNQ